MGGQVVEGLVGRLDGFGFDSEGDGSLGRMVNRVSPQNLHGVLWPLSREQSVSRGGSRETRRGQPEWDRQWDGEKEGMFGT